MRYLAFLSYDGTSYDGWQIQVSPGSIQEEVEKVLSTILNTPTKVYASGRTDKGVHAIRQAMHFDAKEIKDLGKFTYSVNSLLPDDIQIVELKVVDPTFQARYDVKSKTYEYFINVGRYDVFNRNYIYQFLRPLDINKINECLKLFLGEHNFKNFTSKDEDKSNFVRTIYDASISKDKDIIKITFTGNGFMRYMVRMLVGTLIEVGLGRLSIDEVNAILDEKTRKVVSYKAPANGLYLVDVTY